MAKNGFSKGNSIQFKVLSSDEIINGIYNHIYLTKILVGIFQISYGEILTRNI